MFKILCRAALAALTLAAAPQVADADATIPLLSERLGRPAKVQVLGIEPGWMTEAQRLDGGRHISFVGPKASEPDLQLIVLSSWKDLPADSGFTKALEEGKALGQNQISLVMRWQEEDGTNRSLSLINRDAAERASPTCLSSLILFRSIFETELKAGSPEELCTRVERAVREIYVNDGGEASIRG